LLVHRISSSPYEPYAAIISIFAFFFGSMNCVQQSTILV
jgi:hypothetical protein